MYVTDFELPHHNGNDDGAQQTSTGTPFLTIVSNSTKQAAKGR